ncbi:Uncharacterised protein [Chlamydia trachomatis]|nr:Uncharacterised protein [Chlamydia trachomatis]
MASNKIIKKSVPLSVIVSRMEMIETMNTPMNVTDNALKIVSLTMRWRNKTTSPFPLICDQTVPTSVANVVVLIPPPVDPGEAPTNIKKMMSSNVGWVKSGIFNVLEPAVLGETD